MNTEAADGGLLVRREVGLDLAQTILQGVREEAARRRVAMGAGVVDLGGRTVAALRMDGAQVPALDLALDKAFTAVSFGLPTEFWATSTRPDGSDWGLSTALGGRFVVFAGGLPILAGGALAGGLGVSGAASDVDRACAEAGLRAAGLEVGEG
jgi:uncharacterized protein GlcG (DUF336 family)